MEGAVMGQSKSVAAAAARMMRMQAGYGTMDPEAIQHAQARGEYISTAPRLSSRHVVIDPDIIIDEWHDHEQAMANRLVERIKEYDTASQKENRHERRKREAQSRRAR